ncbi:hypothetical protein D3C71_2112760 [compost metagenome]
MQARPISTTSPTCTKTLLSPPESHTPKSAAQIHTGTIRMTASGMVQLSYSAASTRNTSITASAKTIAAAWLCSTCW